MRKGRQRYLVLAHKLAVATTTDIDFYLLPSFPLTCRQVIMDMEKDSPLIMDHIEDIIGRLLCSQNCSEQGKYNSVISQIRKFSQYWKDNQTMLVQMKEVLRTLLSSDFASEDHKMANLSKNFETIKKSLYIIKDLQDKLNAFELKNLELFKQSDKNALLRLGEILQRQMELDRGNKSRNLLTKEELYEVYNLTSLLLQHVFNRLPLVNVTTHLKETEHIFNLTTNLLDLAFLNKTNFSATKTWQIIKMIPSYKFPYMTEKIRKYLTAIEEVPPLLVHSLFKPTTDENFPEKLLTLQKLFDIIANVNSSHNYLILKFLTDLMQKIQNSVDPSQWNEFNFYWRIGEKLRAAKWNDSDIGAYGQVLDLLHKSLYVPHSRSGLSLKKELAQLNKFVNHLVEEHGEDNIGGAKVSMIFDVIRKTLNVLEDLEERYIKELSSINPLMNVNKETIQKLYQIFKEGLDVLSDCKLTEGTSINKIDVLFNFSHLLSLQELNRSSLWLNTSVEAKVLELLYLSLSPFLREDSQGDERQPVCTVKDFHLITIEMLFNNATLKEALTGSNCSFLFTSLNVENRTIHNHTFTGLFQRVIRDLKLMQTFDTFYKNKYFPEEFQCLIKSLQLSSTFLSNLNSFHNYKNPWIRKMHKSLTAISNNLPQSNLTCRAPLFGSMDVINESSALHILAPFMLNETEAHSLDLSGSPSVWNQSLVSFILLHSELHKNAVSAMLKVSNNAANQAERRDFAKVLSEVANMLSSGQNITSAKQYEQLLEMTRKAITLVGIGLAPNKTETHQFLKFLTWQMNASYLEGVLDSLKGFFNTISDSDYKTYFERLFNKVFPQISVLTQSLFYLTPHWKETNQVLNLSRMIWNTLLLNKTNLNVIRKWEAIKTFMSAVSPQFPEDMWQDLNHLFTQKNGSSLHFNTELERLTRLLCHVLKKYDEEDSQNKSLSEGIHTVLKNLFLKKDFGHGFNVSQLETIPPLTNVSNKAIQRVYDILRKGAITLSDSRLEEAADKERITTLYGFSHFLFPKEFNEALLGQSTLLETKIVDIVHLSLSPFLETRNRKAVWPENCSYQDVIHVIFQMLFQNATFQESLKYSHCELLFTSRDFENRTMHNQTFAELFQLSIRNLELTPELASFYKNNNEHLLSALSCIIKSLQFSSGLLSKVDHVFNFKNHWIKEIYKTLATIPNELPANNSTCPVPVLHGANNIVNYYSSNIASPLIANDTAFHLQNAMDNLAAWNNFSVLFTLLQENANQDFSMNEILQTDEDDSSQSGWSNFSDIWDKVSKWNPTEANYAKLADRILSHTGSIPKILEASVSIFKKVMFLDLLKELKEDLDQFFSPNVTNLEYGFDSIIDPSIAVAKALFNKTFLWNELQQTPFPNHVISKIYSQCGHWDCCTLKELTLPFLPSRFLFSEFENIFLKMSPNKDLRLYLNCVMKVTEGLERDSSENATLSPHLAQLKKVLLIPLDTSKKDASVPEMLMLRLSQLQGMTSLLCDSESIKALQQTCQLPDTSFSELCKHSESHKKLLHDVELSDLIVTSLIHQQNVTEEFRKTVIGDLTKLQQHIIWFQESVSQLNYFRNIPYFMASVNSVLNITKNTEHSKKQDQNAYDFPFYSIQLLFQILQLESCNTSGLNSQLEVVAKEFCNLSLAEKTRRSYVAGVTVLRYLDVYEFIYKVLLPKELQTSLDQMTDFLKDLDHFKNRFESDLRPLLNAIHSLKDLPQSRNVPLSKALFQASHLTLDKGAFKTLSKVLCNQEITPLFFESLLPDFEEQNFHRSSAQDDRVQHIMKKYGIPQDSTPFCLSFYLDLVKTPTGALIWSFLKPMLLGKILYTPNTPETQAIMEKSNSTMQLMADLMNKSREWLDNSPLIMNSLTTLNETIPIVKNALRNPFVQVFIKLMVKLDAVDLLYQIEELDDIRSELQNNADILNQLSILARLAMNVSSCVLFDRIRPYNTTEELETVAKDLFLKNELFGSVIFKLPSIKNEEEALGGLSLPPLVNYTIRMSSKITQTTKRIREKVWTVGPHNSASQSQIYSRAFIYLQDSIERAIIEIQTGKSLEEIGVQVQATPYPCYNKDMFLTSVTYSLPFTLMAAWVLYIAAFVKKLVQEKDLRLYEYMKMMGVNSSSHFFAWFIECAIFLLITVTFLIVILKVGNILPKINVVILFLYLMDYSFSIIAMCYLISAFFNNTNIAALVGCLVYVLTFFPFIVLLVVENRVSFSVKSLLSLLSPTAFSYASQYIARYEEQGIGLQWDNMYVSPMSGDDTNFSWMCWLILIDSFVYFILGWYIWNVFPGQYGMAAPWYFPLLPSYWAERCGYFPLWNEKRKGLLFTNFFLRKQPTVPEKMYVQSALPSNLEPEPSNLPVGVSLHGITKVYESKAAVHNLNLNFYEGNITSLLGHNGAGKTTTISILTGLFPATSGTIFVYGKDIRTDQDIIRKNMGICMQHNVLFSYLTTKEHLLLYGKIKVPHWSKEKLLGEVKRTLKETELYNHRYKLAGSLSGGMKRKLSISIALLGGSRVVILDEPTTGVDPCSRRGIWDIISKNKKGRTIILSTHHLDEAEVLSDRIAFLEHGGLKCCGSPFYLKETFGSGYHLTLTKKKTPALSLPEECDTSAVTAMIQSHLPEAYLKEDIGGELVYVLPPFNSSVSVAYQSLLKGLDSGLDDLHIGCFGISDSTVEEVFLNLTKDEQTALSEEVPACTVDNHEMNADNFTEKDDQALVKSRKANDFPLLLRKAAALCVKRFHHTRRNVKGFIAQVLLPVFFVATAMGLGTLRTEVAEYPALHLSPSLYGASNQADFFGNYNETTDALVASVLSFPGVDNTCLNTSHFACFEEVVTDEWTFSGNQSAQYSVCNCTGKSQICPKVNASLPHKKTFSSRTIYNLSGHDIETYLLVTAKDFVQKRYGGWSFGLPLTSDLQFDVRPVPANRTITKVSFGECCHKNNEHLEEMAKQFVLFKFKHPFGIKSLATPNLKVRCSNRAEPIMD
ncbi:hypothetical protein lerEdw1_004399 [Lerista edwardsae]|nr:hypothetical protein lerEdw1_004399 [Lerista edwardsae]